MEEKKRASLIGFNQDSSTYMISGKKGHKIFTLDHVNGNIELINDGGERVFILDRLFSSSLLVFVPFSKPRCVHLRHLIQDVIIMTTSIQNKIVNLKLNRKKLVVCTTDSIVIYDTSEMVQGHAIFEIAHNEKGVFTMNLSPETNDQCLLAYPAKSTSGEVQIFDTISYTSKLLIPAHTNPLGALAFDAPGKLLATASTSGTVIKVFQVSTGLTLFELRRGVARSVTITSLTFSNCAQYLCSSSNTETVHVFKLNSDDRVQKQDGSWLGYLSSAFTTFSSNMLPSSVSGVFTQDRSFATVYLPVAGIKNVSTVVNMHKQLRLYVGTEDSLFIYDIDETGETVLYKKHNLYEVKLSRRISEITKSRTQGTNAFKEIITDSMIEI